MKQYDRSIASMTMGTTWFSSSMALLGKAARVSTDFAR
jgi:hypothetical protein